MCGRPYTSRTTSTGACKFAMMSRPSTGRSGRLPRGPVTAPPASGPPASGPGGGFLSEEQIAAAVAASAHTRVARNEARIDTPYINSFDLWWEYDSLTKRYCNIDRLI